MPEDVGQAMGMTPAMQRTGAAQGTASAPAASQGRQAQQPAQAQRPAQAQQPAQAQRPMQSQQPVQGMTPAMQNSQAAQTPAQGGMAAPNNSRPTAQKGGNIAGRNAASAKGGNAQAAGGIRRDMPVEQIYSMLNRDSAAAVVIPIGIHKGKTLGQVAVEKPANLQWYVDSYGGPDNLLRAAAKFLIDAALGQAS